MRFIETPVFTRRITKIFNDDQYRSTQLALALRPEQGVVIQGSGGLRKLRWLAGRRGKRGGVRLIYYWDKTTETILMLFVYTKQEQGDLTPDQVRMLGRIVSEEFK